MSMVTSPLPYLPTEDHKKSKYILVHCNHIALNTNTRTRLPLHQTQQAISSDITTTSEDLNDCTSWQTIHFLTSDHLSLLPTISIYCKTETTPSLT